MQPESSTKGVKSASTNKNDTDQVTKSVSETPMQSTERSIAKSAKKTLQPSTEQISQALQVQCCPTNKEICPFCKFIANTAIDKLLLTLLI